MTGELYLDLKILILCVGCYIIRLKQDDFEEKYGHPLWIVYHAILALGWIGLCVGFGCLFPTFLVFKIG